MKRQWRRFEFWLFRTVLRFILWMMPAEYVIAILVFRVLLSALELDAKQAAKGA